MSANDIAVDLGRYKDKTIAELADALDRLLRKFHIETDCGTGANDPGLHWAECPAAEDALARARTDPSWQQYSKDNQEPLELSE